MASLGLYKEQERWIKFLDNKVQKEPYDCWTVLYDWKWWLVRIRLSLILNKIEKSSLLSVLHLKGYEIKVLTEIIKIHLFKDVVLFVVFVKLKKMKTGLEFSDTWWFIYGNYNDIS